ncbi:Pentatricopeptide repeat-containing protein, mitochondrial [Vitis vinifera]|uniref:Pentatricopeptide repeat-containing protein, mitochondrial n=1 Tax=Vitis vinifera TaxID=29760 RepID=A0A438HMP6_VITVI|nr:Pentatricopeptide repeat-containing protein, mitochondrial [Vitis vinifera]
MSHKNVVTWTSMISALVHHGFYLKALNLFKEMLESGARPNQFTFSVVVRACIGSSLVDMYFKLGVALRMHVVFLVEVQQIHGLALKLGTEVDVVVGSALVDAYGKCGNMEWGRKVLNSMEWKDSFVWSSIISGYARNGSGDEAVCLFRDMCRQGMKPDQHALSSTLKACAEIEDLETGVQVHNCNEICEAHKLFRRIDDKDIVAWNSMILGYAQMEEESSYHCIKIFRELCQTPALKPDGATIIAILKSCQNQAGLITGIQIHTMIMKSSLSCETLICNAVINMYSKCGDVDDAYKAFIDIVHRDAISWSSIIGSYQQNGFELEALSLCKEMLADGVYVTSFSLPLCIAACSELAAIDVGKQFHSSVIKLGFDGDVYVGSSIIDMYAKCGFMEESRKPSMNKKTQIKQRSMH